MVLALAVISGLSERGRVRIGPNDSFRSSPIPALFAAVLFGPLAGGIVGASSMLGDANPTRDQARERAPQLKFLLYASSVYRRDQRWEGPLGSLSIWCLREIGTSSLARLLARSLVSRSDVLVCRASPRSCAGEFQ